MTQSELRWPSSAHAARIESSPRLQRCLAALRRYGATGATTYQLFDATGSMAVHSDVSELRANGLRVDCWMDRAENGRRIYRYRLVEEKESAA